MPDKIPSPVRITRADGIHAAEKIRKNQFGQTLRMQGKSRKFIFVELILPTGIADNFNCREQHDRATCDNKCRDKSPEQHFPNQRRLLWIGITECPSEQGKHGNFVAFMRPRQRLKDAQRDAQQEPAARAAQEEEMPTCPDQRQIRHVKNQSGQIGRREHPAA